MILPLYNALYCASVAGSVSEIYLHKVWNYKNWGVVEKTMFRRLLPVKPQHSVFFRVTEYLAPPWPHVASLDSLKYLLKLS